MAELRLRRLFPDYENEKTLSTRRRYIRDEMLRMISEGDFYLTEVMNQRPAVKQACNEVIFGHGVDDGSMGGERGSHVTTFPIDPKIRNHQVLIESIRGENVKYLDGVREIEGIIVGHQTKHEVRQTEDNWVDMETTKAKLNLREAWLCLKFHGENVTRSNSQWDKDNLWKYREVKQDRPVDKKQNPKREVEASL